MPHPRARHLESLIKQSLKFSPITGIFGHRQVGKTTLASKLAQRYLTLDIASTLEMAQTDPGGLIAQNVGHPLVIDECQMAPPLFSALKEWIRAHPKPGQFLLTGSVRFSSRKAIQESLTGRMIAWELLPMDLSEAHSEPLPRALINLLESSTVETDLPASTYATTAAIKSYLAQGGLPGIFAIRNPGIRKQRFETQLQTILERDLQLVLQTTLSVRTLNQLLRSLALQQCEPLDWTKTSRQTRISIPTLRKLIAALESLFVIRLIETEGTEKRPVLFFEDQGEASALASGKYDELTDFTRFLYANLRVQFAYRPEYEGRIFQFRTRGGAYVPLCFQSRKQEIGVIPMLQASPGPSVLASARSFLTAYPRSKVILVHPGKGDQALSKRLRVVGASQVL